MVGWWDGLIVSYDVRSIQWWHGGMVHASPWWYGAMVCWAHLVHTSMNPSRMAGRGEWVRVRWGVWVSFESPGGEMG